MSRVIAVLLLPLYTRYLTPDDYGQIETLLALTTVMGLVLRAGITSAFFRFYFDVDDDAGRLRVLRTSFWFTMGAGTLGLALLLALAEPVSPGPVRGRRGGRPRPCCRDLAWATVNYEQLTALFRVEERSLAFVSASLANVLITIGLTLLLVVALEKGALGVIVGNFSGTLIVYLALLGYRREQLGLQFDRGLLREMNRFGLLPVPTALFLWVTNFSATGSSSSSSPTSPRRACIRSASGSRRRWCSCSRRSGSHGRPSRTRSPTTTRRAARTPTCSRTSPSSPAGSPSR